jgi:hypothetical protein
MRWDFSEGICLELSDDDFFFAEFVSSRLLTPFNDSGERELHLVREYFCHFPGAEVLANTVF